MSDTPWPAEYRRKVTRCKAMRVTAENLQNIAAWCGGSTWAGGLEAGGALWTSGLGG
jgi:hypothetical protein